MMNEISGFTQVLLFVTGGLIMGLAGMLVSGILRPDRPNPEKRTTYECGEDTIGSAWVQFNMRFYVMALIFLIFDVEVIFLFPWATVYTHPELLASDSAWTAYAFAEVLVFTLILVAGLAWIWHQNDLDWVKPEPLIPNTHSTIPDEVYQQVNDKFTSFRPAPKSV